MRRHSHQKLEQLAAPRSAGSAPAEVHFTSDEVSAEMAQSMGAVPAAPATATRPVSAAPSAPDAVVGSGEVQVTSYQVKLEETLPTGNSSLR